MLAQGMSISVIFSQVVTQDDFLIHQDDISNYTVKPQYKDHLISRKGGLKQQVFT